MPCIRTNKSPPGAQRFLAQWQTAFAASVELRRPIVGTTSEALLTSSTPHPLMIFFTRIRETDQIFAHVENKSADMESAMTFKQGVSGTLTETDTIRVIC